MNRIPVSQWEYLVAGTCLRKVYEARERALAHGVQPGGDYVHPGPAGLSARAIRFTKEQREQVRAAARRVYCDHRRYVPDLQVEAHGCTTTIDFMDTSGSSVRPLLVQSTYSVKPQALDLLRYQLFLLREAGYQATGGGVICLVKDYEPDSVFEPQRALVERECGKHLKGGLKQVENRVQLLLHTFSRSEPPQLCGERDKCPACMTSATDDRGSWAANGALAPPGNHGEKNPDIDTSLETLFRGGGVADKLRKRGYASLDEVPLSAIPGRRQQMQVQAVQERRIHVDRAGLRHYCERLVFPRVFLDFETVSQALPPLPGIRPWEHVPMQFSVHRQEYAGAPVNHRDFIADDMAWGADHRLDLARALAKAVEGAGSIMVFSAAFERRVLLRLAQWIPDFSEQFNDAINRIVDVQEPFNEFLLYFPEQKGKTGLKAVLPALTGSGYEHLDVADGLDASLRWFYTYRRSSPEVENSNQHREAVGQALRDYCALDTEALVRIVERLETLVDTECT